MPKSHPKLALVAFVAAFLFAALPFAFADTDNLLIGIPCIIASLSCSILFLRLLIGDVRFINWTLAGIAGFLFVLAGPRWYLIATVAICTLLCSLMLAHLIGNFKPLIRVSRRSSAMH